MMKKIIELNNLLEPVFQDIAVKRFCTEEDVINGILFLMDPKTSYVTNTFLNIDGGYIPCNVLNYRVFTDSSDIE